MTRPGSGLSCPRADRTAKIRPDPRDRAPADRPEELTHQQAGSTYLTGRALESLAALLVILGVSLVGLDPSVGRAAFAVVLFFCAVGSGISPVRAARAYRSTHVKPDAFNLRMLLTGLLIAGYAVAGATLLAQAGGGLHWLPFAFILAVSIAASNAWILLVEVLR
jgi:hypothetical protein